MQFTFTRQIWFPDQTICQLSKACFSPDFCTEEFMKLHKQKHYFFNSWIYDILVLRIYKEAFKKTIKQTIQVSQELKGKNCDWTHSPLQGWICPSCWEQYNRKDFSCQLLQGLPQLQGLSDPTLSPSWSTWYPNTDGDSGIKA